jgi:hypothetical protein
MSTCKWFIDEHLTEKDMCTEEKRKSWGETDHHQQRHLQHDDHLHSKHTNIKIPSYASFNYVNVLFLKNKGTNSPPI